MKILIHVAGLSQSNGGIRQYAATLLRMLHKDTENQYYIYHDLNDPEILDAINDIPRHVLVKSKEFKTAGAIVQMLFVKSFNSMAILFGFKRAIIKENYFSLYCKKQQIRIIHCPGQSIPVIKNIKLIPTLHDVQQIHFPEFFTAEERAKRSNVYLDSCRRSDMIIVSYNHVKKDLIKYFNVPEEKIETILLQMDRLWFQKYTDKDVIKLPENLDAVRYIMYPANTWKHKNHVGLLEAIALLRDNEKIKVTLICTGDIDSTHGKIVQEKCNSLHLNDQVTFLGIVAENLLFSLYKKAVAVVIPTLYEAGSFPLMESMFLNVPVVCSNVTSLPETINNELFLFDPKDIHSIADKIKKIYLDSEFRKLSISNSEIQRELLKSTGSLTQLQEAYKRMFN